MSYSHDDRCRLVAWYREDVDIIGDRLKILGKRNIRKRLRALGDMGILAIPGDVAILPDAQLAQWWKDAWRHKIPGKASSAGCP